MVMCYFREPTSGFTHLAAALLSLIGLIWLVFLTIHDIGLMITMVIYGVSMTLLYLASTLYHLVKGPPRLIDLLVRFDLIGIHLLIAGTYTPLCYHFLDGIWRWGMLVVIWTLALGGSLYVIFVHRRGRKSALRLTFYYVAMGCLGVLVAPQFIALLPPGATWLIIAGGAVYLVGAVIYALDKPNIHRYFNAHDLWHLFVMGGSACFFAAILQHVALA